MKTEKSNKMQVNNMLEDLNECSFTELITWGKFNGIDKEVLLNDEKEFRSAMKYWINSETDARITINIYGKKVIV